MTVQTTPDGTTPPAGHGGDLPDLGGLTYGAYLRLDGLLAQQAPVADPAAHDELLFITVHQAYELWFKLILLELTDARDRMLAGEAYRPRLRLARCHTIGRVLVGQFDVIDSMSPRDFLAFRDRLSPASGFQSAQFREIEFISGLKDPGYPDRVPGLTDAERARLTRRMVEPSLWDGYLAVLRHAGFAVDTAEQRAAALARVATEQDRYPHLWDLAEALLDHDQTWGIWRARHAVMTERQIGARRGTGGSSGGHYLRGRVELRFFPELWELRADL